VTSIQSDLQGLTLRAAPLQTKTYELQERTERLMGGLLRLSLARSKDDAGKVLAAVGADSQAIDTLRGEIRTLDPKAAPKGPTSAVRSARSPARSTSAWPTRPPTSARARAPVPR
jgi:hypothetical protein